MLRDNAEKISESDRRKVEDAISAVKEALKGGDAEAIKSAGARLNETSQAVSGELYRAASEKAQAGRAQPGQEQPRGGAPEPERKEDEVIDAEVVEEHKK
jgi:molecular chaperone DnaK